MFHFSKAKYSTFSQNFFLLSFTENKFYPTFWKRNHDADLTFHRFFIEMNSCGLVDTHSRDNPFAFTLTLLLNCPKEDTSSDKLRIYRISYVIYILKCYLSILENVCCAANVIFTYVLEYSRARYYIN